ncbi:iron complex transport system substrate-binding protein [Propionibacterium cyclohexanicum]|uniref:Iron complex transport system substrate-binding protein n=1 Tax=Propionibacterium cyclohexanicum TaxID=64702 RepID=A0A1H9PIA3_9ACTN|nr:ABC transporter substrate-binding protein [Propionibacterium cyclohexanicum]SER47293.1 iron complex transport system substrate-binding protein [Propionibacterium cyclohexanicum]
MRLHTSSSATRLVTGTLGACLALSMAACSASPAASSSSPSATASTQTITDQSQRTVSVPTSINRIADSWPAHTEVLMLLGAGNKIVATANTPKSSPWMFTVQPSLRNAVTTNAQNFNTEALAEKQPDIHFMSPGTTNSDKIQAMGIPTVQLYFSTYEQMKQTISITGQILGKDASARAAAYDAYLDHTVSDVQKVTATIPAASKPKVLHIQSLEPLQVDGSDTIIDQWIKDAGGVNAAQSITGNKKPVSIEQVTAWNPDVVIIGTGDPGSAAALEKDPAWAGVKAVQDKKVYSNPAGVFQWDRYSPEAVLELPWAAKTLHPELFPNTDMNSLVKQYYQQFLNYPLSDAQAQLILAGRPPANS